MPCFHFLVHGEVQTGDDGFEFPDLEAARHEAVRLVGEILAKEPQTFSSARVWGVDVTNCDGQLLLGLRLACVTGEDDVEARSRCP